MHLSGTNHFNLIKFYSEQVSIFFLFFIVKSSTIAQQSLLREIKKGIYILYSFCFINYIFAHLIKGMSMEVLFIKFKAVTPIFWISIALVSLFIILGVFFPD